MLQNIYKNSWIFNFCGFLSACADDTVGVGVLQHLFENSVGILKVLISKHTLFLSKPHTRVCGSEMDFLSFAKLNIFFAKKTFFQL